MNTPASAIVAAVRRLESDDGRTRVHARQELSQAGDDATWHLIQAARPQTRRTRIEALKALASVPHPDAASTFVDLLGDPDADVRWLAADGLAALGEPGLCRALALLVEFPDRPEPLHGLEHVLRTFAESDHARTVEPVLHAFHEAPASVRVPTAAHEALESLRREGHEPVAIGGAA